MKFTRSAALTALLALLPFFAQATTLTCPSNNAPGGQIFALPGSTFGFCLEDLSHGDADFNDSIALGSISADGTALSINWVASSAAFSNPIYLDGTFLFSNLVHPGVVTVSGLTPGAELVFMSHSASNWWSTGPGTRNSSGDPQFVVWQQGGSSIPEPSAGALAAFGLAWLIFARFNR